MAVSFVTLSCALNFIRKPPIYEKNMFCVCFGWKIVIRIHNLICASRELKIASSIFNYGVGDSNVVNCWLLTVLLHHPPLCQRQSCWSKLRSETEPGGWRQKAPTAFHAAPYSTELIRNQLMWHFEVISLIFSICTVRLRNNQRFAGEWFDIHVIFQLMAIIKLEKKSPEHEKLSDSPFSLAFFRCSHRFWDCESGAKNQHQKFLSQ